MDIGSKVKKGQVLATIDAPEINTQVQELNAKVQSAKAKFESSKDYFERINIAYQKKGVIAPSEWQRIKKSNAGRQFRISGSCAFCLRLA